MIRKQFAMSIIAASIAMSACTSDSPDITDDTTPDTSVDVGENAGGTTGEVAGGATEEVAGGATEEVAGGATEEVAGGTAEVDLGSATGEPVGGTTGESTGSLAGGGSVETANPDPDEGSDGDLADLFADENDATFNGFLSIASTHFETKLTQTTLDPNPWTVFASTDEALAGAEWVLSDHVIVNAALSPAYLLANPVQTSNSGKTMEFGGSVDSLTLNGMPVALINTGGSFLYRFDGDLHLNNTSGATGGDTTGSSDGGDNGGEANGGEANPGPTGATPSGGNTAFDTIVNSDNHTILESLLIGSGLAQILDDPTAEFTIFAPTDAAFQALGSISDNELVRLLMNHVVPGAIQSGDIANRLTGNDLTVLDTLAYETPAQSLSFAYGDAGIYVTDGMQNTSFLEGPLDLNAPEMNALEGDESPTGIVHVISTVLRPMAADRVNLGYESDTGGDGGTGGSSPLSALLAGEAGEFTKFIAAIESFGAVEKFTRNADVGDSDPWAVFAISDENLGSSEWDLFPHLIRAAEVNPEEGIISLTPQALIDNSPMFPHDNSRSLTFTGTADALVLNGEPVRLVSDSASKIYVVGQGAQSHTEQPDGGETTGGEPTSSFNGLAAMLSDETGAHFYAFLAAVSGSGLEEKLTRSTEVGDDDPWTIFAPTDAWIRQSNVDYLLTDYLIMGSALTPEDLLSGNAPTVTVGGKSLVFRGNEEIGLILNDYPVSLINVGSSIIYRFDGTLQ